MFIWLKKQDGGIFDIEFKEQKMVLVGTKNEGALGTKEQYENCEPNYAHLFKDGIIRQHGIPIGTKEDLIFLENKK